MPDGLIVTKKVHFTNTNKGRRQITLGTRPVRNTPSGRVPRISRQMALAIKFDGLLRSGAVRDQGELAALGHVSRPRVTQIMNLLHLAPDIQEELLSLPRVTSGRDPIGDHDLRPIAAEVEWGRQRRMWREVQRDCCVLGRKTV